MHTFMPLKVLVRHYTPFLNFLLNFFSVQLNRYFVVFPKAHTVVQSKELMYCACYLSLNLILSSGPGRMRKEDTFVRGKKDL